MLEAPTFRVVLQAGSTAKGSRSKQEDAFCCQTIHIPAPAIAVTPCSRISSATMDRHQMKQQQLPIENTQLQPIPDGIATHVIGVFDGHGGYSVSHLLSNIVPEYLCYILCQEASAPKETPTTQNDPEATPHDNSRELLTRAFKRVFYDVDDFILHWNHRDLSDLTNEILSLCMKASLRDPVAVNDFGNSCLPTAALRKNSCERSEDEEEEELERDTSGSPAPAMMMSFRSEEQPLGYPHSPQYSSGFTTDRTVGFVATGTPNTALRSHLQIRAGSTQGSNHKRGRELDQDENQENGESANQVSLYGVIRPATALCLSNYFADDSPLLADRTARTFATPTKKPGSNCLSPPPALTSQLTCINVRPLSPLIIRPLTTPTHVSRSPQQRSFLGNPLGFGQLNYSALKGGSSPTGSSSTGGGRRGMSMGLSSATWEEETSRGTAPSISTSQQDQSGPRDTQNFYPSSSVIGLNRDGGRNLSLAFTTSPLGHCGPVSRCTPVGAAPTLSGSQLRSYHQPRLPENVADEETAELIRVASQHPQTKVGSTASLCAITDTSIAIANVGDSRTIICELFIEDSNSPSSPTADSRVVRGRVLKSTCDHRVSMISEKHRLSTIEHTADYQAWRSIRDGSLADAWWGASPLKPQQIVSWAANDDDVGEAAASHDVADNDRHLPVLGSIAMNNHLLGELGVSRSIGSFNLKVLKPQSQAVVQSQSSSSAVDSGSRHKSKNNRLLTKRKGLERAVDTCGRLQVDSALSPLSSVCDVTVFQADEFSQGLAMSESRSLLTSTNAAAEEASRDGTAVKGRKLLMVLSGTDGLWDVGTNEEVLDVLLQHPFMISAVKSYLLPDPPLTSTPERTTTNTTGVCPTAATPTMKPASSRDSHFQQQPYFICSSVLPPASFALPESEGSLNNAASSPQLHPLIDCSRSSGGPQQSREWAFASEQLILSQNSSDSVATSSPLIQAPSTPPVRPAVCVPANQHVLRDLPQMPNCRARSHPAGLSTPNGATQFSTPKKNPLDCGGGGSLQQAVDKLINWAIHTRHGSDNVTVTVSLISLEGGLQAPKQ